MAIRLHACARPLRTCDHEAAHLCLCQNLCLELARHTWATHVDRGRVGDDVRVREDAAALAVDDERGAAAAPVGKKVGSLELGGWSWGGRTAAYA
eukprot:350929-Chlamydomonas_euryale.AAC.3